MIIQLNRLCKFSEVVGHRLYTSGTQVSWGGSFREKDPQVKGGKLSTVHRLTSSVVAHRGPVCVVVFPWFHIDTFTLLV